MQKKWMFTGVAVLAVAGAMPWVVGYVTEQQWQQATEQMNRAQPFLKMETGAYHRGVLSSELSGALVVQNPETGESHSVAYRADVTHGVTGSLLAFEPVQGWSPEGSDWFPDQKPRLTLETRLWGTATLELEAPVMTVANEATGETLRTSGGLARLEVSDTGAQADALMVWPAISLSGPEIDIRLADIHLEQSLNHVLADVWTGGGEFEIGSMTMARGGDEPVKLRAFSVSTNTETNADQTRLDSRVTLSLEEVIRGDQGYGPHRVEVALEDLDLASWSALTQGMSDLQMLAHSTGPAATSGPEQQLAAMQQVNQALRELAAAGFSLGVPQLSVATPEGPVNGSLAIRHPELSADEKAGMLMVMQRLTGDMTLSVPTALAENYPSVRMQLAPMIKQGLLIEEGDRLVMQAVMKDLMVDVNGLEIPLPPLL